MYFKVIKRIHVGAHKSFKLQSHTHTHARIYESKCLLFSPLSPFTTFPLDMQVYVVQNIQDCRPGLSPPTTRSCCFIR